MVYIIGDLHLSFGVNKPMNIFGEKWNNHETKILKDWKEKVKMEDTVILAGDFSWAMTLDEALEDFKYIDSLPGKKIFLKGNHDYWWVSVTKNLEFLKKHNIKNISFLQNNAYIIENYAICGTKGWDRKDIENYKNIRRENLRLQNSIKDMEMQLSKLSKENQEKIVKICVMHYPPYLKSNDRQNIEREDIKESDELNFMKTITKAKIPVCYYGHLHEKGHKEAINGEYMGVKLHLISSDYVDFKLTAIDY